MLQDMDEDIQHKNISRNVITVDAFSSLENAAQDQVTSHMLIQAICECMKQKNLSNALWMLTYLRKHGMDTQRDLGNFVVPMLVSVGRLEDAQRVFDRLTYRNHYSWSALICGYINKSKLRHAFELFNQMREASVQPTIVACVSLFKVCGRLKDADRGREFHAYIDKLGLAASDSFIVTTLIAMYMKCGLLEEAQKVFDKCKSRDVFAWNVLIAGYVHHKQGNNALLLFEQMQKERISPDPVTLACVLRACGDAAAQEMGQKICNQIESTGLIQSDSFVASAVIGMHAKFGCFAKAREVLDKLQEPTEFSWTALIVGYVKHEHAEEALDCFEQMKRNGVSPNANTCACILRACASVKAIKKGQEMHTEIVMKGFPKGCPDEDPNTESDMEGFLDEDLILVNALVNMYAKCSLLAEARHEFDKLQVHNVVSWNALISGYVKKGDFKETLSCFERMKCEGFSADCITYYCILKACAIEGTIRVGQGIHCELESKHLLADQPVCNALIGMYVKCDMLSEAQKVFDKLPVRNLAAWTLLISGYAQKGKPENVFSAFERMKKEQHKPDLATFLIVLHACNQAGQVEMRERYFDSMTSEYDIVPTLEHYTCIIDLLGRSGRLESAVKMIKKMPFSPNEVIWHSILAACRNNLSNIEFARAAFEHAVRLDAKDAVAYTCMSNINLDAGLPEDADTVDRRRAENRV